MDGNVEDNEKRFEKLLPRGLKHGPFIIDPKGFKLGLKRLIETENEKLKRKKLLEGNGFDLGSFKTKDDVNIYDVIFNGQIVVRVEAGEEGKNLYVTFQKRIATPSKNHDEGLLVKDVPNSIPDFALILAEYLVKERRAKKKDNTKFIDDPLYLPTLLIKIVHDLGAPEGDELFYPGDITEESINPPPTRRGRTVSGDRTTINKRGRPVVNHEERLRVFNDAKKAGKSHQEALDAAGINQDGLDNARRAINGRGRINTD